MGWAVFGLWRSWLWDVWRWWDVFCVLTCVCFLLFVRRFGWTSFDEVWVSKNQDTAGLEVEISARHDFWIFDVSCTKIKRIIITTTLIIVTILIIGVWGWLNKKKSMSPFWFFVKIKFFDFFFFSFMFSEQFLIKTLYLETWFVRQDSKLRLKFGMISITDLSIFDSSVRR